MRRIVIFVAMISAFIGMGIAGVGTVQAANKVNSVITDQQISVIRMRCGDIQATLNRTHETDKVLRVNKGYQYKAIMLDKLMTPLNQRIAANQIDGGKLVAIAAEYSRAFEKFDDAYSTYERSLSALIKIDCNKQPTAFYDQLTAAYENRGKLFEIDTGLIELSKEFKAEAKKVFNKIGDTKGAL